jgi:hypothetical protein
MSSFTRGGNELRASSNLRVTEGTAADPTVSNVLGGDGGLSSTARMIFAILHDWQPFAVVFELWGSGQPAIIGARGEMHQCWYAGLPVPDTACDI